jgi:hypothetical protein
MRWPLTSAPWPSLLVCLAASVAAAGCGSGTEPVRGDASLTIVSGSGQADTIDTQLPVPLIVAVRDSFGRPAANVAVDWGTAADCPAACMVGVSADSGAPTLQTVQTSSDATGRAQVWVTLGQLPGSGALAIRVPALGLTGSAAFLVSAGRPAHVHLDPSEVAVALGVVGQFNAALTDRHDNPLPAILGFTPEIPGIVEVDAAGVITPLAYGRTAVTIRAETFATTGFVSVVPAGTLVITTNEGEPSILTTSGTDRVQIPQLDDRGQPLNVVALAWRPDGAALAFEAAFGGGSSSLYTVTLGGTPSLLVPATGDDSTVYEPRWSRDGQWVYYRLAAGAFAGEIWRTRPDGTGAERVGAQGAGAESDYQPDPSPDGNEVVFTTSRGGTPDAPVLVICTLLTGAERALVPGWRPRWSPDGQWIAYLRDFDPNGYGALWLVRPDGTEAHAVSPPGVYNEAPLDWSPDSQWVVGTGAAITLVQVSSGLVVSVGTLGNLRAGAWRP